MAQHQPSSDQPAVREHGTPTSRSGIRRRVSVTDISPVPLKPLSELRKSSRRCMEATILTASPYKRKLKEAETNRTEKNKHQLKLAEKRTATGRKTKKDSTQTNVPVRNSGKKKPKLQTATDDTPCGWCRQRYNRPAAPAKINMDWLQCCKCKVWMHESCAEEAGVIGDDDFTCGKCCE